MNSDSPTNPLLDVLRDRERALELEHAQVLARLEEVRELLAYGNTPRRRIHRRQPPPAGVEAENLPGLIAPGADDEVPA